jgi:hypothetical protein
MPRMFLIRFAGFALAIGLIGAGVWYALRPTPGRLAAEQPIEVACDAKPTAPHPLESRFAGEMRPFLERHCFTCHGADKQESALDLRHDGDATAIAKNLREWGLVLERLQAGEMPPADAPQPTPAERTAAVVWLRDLRDYEVHKGPGGEGVALARRLSDAEFNSAVRDLTGVDIKPAHEFPAPTGPASEAGTSLALLKKHLAAARLVANHVVLKPDGFAFAAHAMVTEADRDQYCVKRLLAFYKAQTVDYADYFLAAWRYHHRGALGRPSSSRDDFAVEAGLSEKYLAAVWSAFTEVDAETGPLAVVRKLWQNLPAPVTTNADAARPACARLRDLVVHMRQQLRPNLKMASAEGISAGSRARQRRHYSGDVSADLQKLAEQLFPGAEADLINLFPKEKPDAEGEKRLREELEQFCSVFPDEFFIANGADGGRPLSDQMQGYCRDDEPLCELVLNDAQRQELDALWVELNFITAAPIRQYKDANISADVRAVEQGRLAAEPSHLKALVEFATRAYRRPLSAAERDDLLAFYRVHRQQHRLAHEDAMRDALVWVLMSPHFYYFDPAARVQATARVE